MLTGYSFNKVAKYPQHHTFFWVQDGAIVKHALGFQQLLERLW
jgi:hypothetical protein